MSWTIGVPGFDSRRGLGIFLLSNGYQGTKMLEF